jgi:hypothetical protein
MAVRVCAATYVGEPDIPAGLNVRADWHGGDRGIGSADGPSRPDHRPRARRAVRRARQTAGAVRESESRALVLSGEPEA